MRGSEMKGWNLDIKSSLSTAMTGMRVILSSKCLDEIQTNILTHD